MRIEKTLFCLRTRFCFWYQLTLGQRSMIDLKPYVSETQIKRGAELSTELDTVAGEGAERILETQMGCAGEL